MKSIVLITALLSINICYSQVEETNSLNKTAGQSSFTTNTSDSLKAIQIFNEDVNRQINQIDSHIGSIKIKWDYILNNPAEKEIAEENGWFTDMTRIKKELLEKRENLLNSLK